LLSSLATTSGLSIEDLVEFFQKIIMMDSSQMELASLVFIAHILGGHFQWDLLPLLREWD
jgi:hypothetical protein